MATVSSREDLGVSPHDACKQSSVLFYQQEGNFVGLMCDFKGSAFHSLYLKKCTRATMKGDQQCQTQEGSLAGRLT